MTVTLPSLCAVVAVRMAVNLTFVLPFERIACPK